MTISEADERVATLDSAALASAAPSGVLFLATAGRGSMDKYAQRLAAHLDVETLETDVYQRTAELFNVPCVCRTSFAGFVSDLGFMRRLRAADARLIHLPNHHLGRYGVFLSRPYVVTVHDLIRYFDLRGGNVFIHPPNVRDRICLRLDYLGIQKADAIIAVSETTKRDVVHHLGVPEERVFVVYEGIDHTLYRPVEERLLAEPYVLYVGSEHPRKNLATLIAAFAAVKRDPAYRELKLVKVGRPGGREACFREQTEAAMREFGVERDVVFTDYVPEEDLPAWYSGATCLVQPSLYEGFGFPPLEAMACGCPAVVSSAGSLPEVAGEAAIVVEPRDAEALANAIRTLAADTAVREELVERGLEHAAHFSWQRAAYETARVYDAALDGNV